MYVMAAEKRLLVPIDASTRRPCYAQVSVRYLASSKYSDADVSLVAPCLIPETSCLEAVGEATCVAYFENQSITAISVDKDYVILFLASLLASVIRCDLLRNSLLDVM